MVPYLFIAIPDTNHNANPINPNHNSKVNPNPASGKMQICEPADLITSKMRMVTVDFFCGSNG